MTKVILLIILLFVGTANAETQWCFDKSNASEIVFSLDKYDSCQEQLQLCITANSEAQEIIKVKDEIITLQKEEIEFLKNVKNEYKEIIKFQQDALKEATKPNIWKRILDVVGFIGIGALMGLMI